jgi:hypothetical protein
MMMLFRVMESTLWRSQRYEKLTVSGGAGSVSKTYSITMPKLAPAPQMAKKKSEFYN